MSNSLWNTAIEISFFQEALKNNSPEKLFYYIGQKYYAYVPKDTKNNGQTLQSRNALIGDFTEKWCQELLSPLAKENSLYAINGVVCEEIGLTKQSPADLAFCTSSETIQKPENIKLIFEIKMSIVSNYEYDHQSNKIKYIGDYTSHQGNPSLLRSDSMLKAMGKAIAIRVSSPASASIPIIVLGNSPISESYKEKVDFLKSCGVIQGFWSLYPNPTEKHYIKETPKQGFLTIENINMLKGYLTKILNMKLLYFSSMIPKEKLGEIIRLANEFSSDEEEKAIKFLEYLRECS
ncbi:hypothetical protein BREVNS_1559 [Brevinematales bacterium NS]|nr:hypothetical protein [Brevinematales bacterium]QJR22309.1 hypothetical protein BREVNS_1559 [Brevinematales bacterium NS]